MGVLHDSVLTPSSSNLLGHESIYILNSFYDIPDMKFSEDLFIPKRQIFYMYLTAEAIRSTPYL